MAADPELRKHQEWLGYLQPVGVIVSPAALVAAQAHVNANVIREQQAFQALLKEIEGSLYVKDLQELCCGLLGWSRADFAPGNSEDLIVSLPEYGERLSPTFAVRDLDDEKKWLIFIQEFPDGTELDKAENVEKDRWHASPQARFERLLREKSVPIGLITNGAAIRLVYAPHRESSGHLTFPVQAMSEVAGRPIFAAFLLLFSADRLFTLPPDRRLPRILDESRKYQSQVSTELAEQVLAALYELLRGFRNADWETNRQLLGHLSPEARDEVYGGLLTTLMRLVFLLYAEERGLLPTESRTYVDYYSVGRLYGRLREDHERHPDTMDQRFGAWAQLLTLFRLIHDGASHGALSLPPRHGKLFDPDAYPFLEGRPRGNKRAEGQRLTPPKLSDGVVYRVLENLLILDGERISYRALDVEQIGSVYEAMMGFTLGIANGDVVALKPDHVVIELEDLLQRPGNERARYLKDVAACDVTGDGLETLKTARTNIEILEALERRLSPHTQRPLQPGSLYLQPTDERRRSGSHYTPRSLTEPIVRTTLKPILDDLGPNPTPEKILELKVCDPAMGSGAFLVEACRLLAERLVAAWVAHKSLPKLPPDEEPVACARRLVAQRCLYGVDKNPFAVDLAKLSLWLATLAKDHPFTFLDHALRHGDSLVGLTREQIASFHWEPQKQSPLIRQCIDEAVERSDVGRARIRALAASDDTDQKVRLLTAVDAAVVQVRLVGDAIVSAFFTAHSKARPSLLQEHATAVQRVITSKADVALLIELSRKLREGDKPVPPFHWEIEFPEVFVRSNSGFDAIVGNPPFLGGTKLEPAYGRSWRDWLVHNIANGRRGTRGAADLCCYFFLRASRLLKTGGVLGMLATKTVSKGDSREIGLQQICDAGGDIIAAVPSMPWPGEAALEVAQVYIRSGAYPGTKELNGRKVRAISPFLAEGVSAAKPQVLLLSTDKAFEGAKLIGDGFIITNEEALELIRSNLRAVDVVKPFLSGKDINDRPDSSPSRHAINFRDYPLSPTSQSQTGPFACDFPECLAIVSSRVKPERLGKSADSSWNKYVRERWWQFALWRPALARAIEGIAHVFVISRVSKYHAITRAQAAWIFSDATVVFATDSFSDFTILQSRIHEIWAKKFCSTLEGRNRYTPSSCFQTFPTPQPSANVPKLMAAGQAYYEYRTEIMKQRGEGLTATYNSFHDPENRSLDVTKLRELHAAMDRLVLDAYGWRDLKPSWEFKLESEEDEEPSSSRRKPWRYRWPDEFRDEVLARLSALNKERAEQEKLAGAAASLNPRPGSSKGRSKAKESPGQRTLF